MTPRRLNRACPAGCTRSATTPFVYFHSIIDAPTCAQNVVPLTELPPVLTSAGTTPNYSFIVPDLCNDGHDDPCPNGEPGGLEQANTFLMKWVPLIMASPAFRQDGLLVIVFDEAGSLRDSSACCSEKQFPNTPNNGFLFPGRGGGQVGAVALSPFIRPGTRTLRRYNHFSLLKTVEQFFGLNYLGYAGQPGLRTFGKDIFTARVRDARRRRRGSQAPGGGEREHREQLAVRGEAVERSRCNVGGEAVPEASPQRC